MSIKARNVLGEPLQACCMDPMTGFRRTGYCEMMGSDQGLHLVCILVTDEFLEFTAQVGNDLSTPMPQYSFPGLKAGDKWCLCVLRWKQALEANKAPQVDLSATHVSALEFVDLEDLKAHAIAEV